MNTIIEQGNNRAIVVEVKGRVKKEAEVKV
jgi:hypothetical protein